MLSQSRLGIRRRHWSAMFSQDSQARDGVELVVMVERREGADGMKFNIDLSEGSELETRPLHFLGSS